METPEKQTPAGKAGAGYSQELKPDCSAAADLAHGHELPQPLVPADTDLRDFPFMPLDVQRFRSSDLAAVAPPDAGFAAVLLWCAAWHQVPAASLPDDDRVLANLAGYGRAVRRWERVRADALRGFVKASDGRLYHRTVAEKALEAWLEKVAARIAGAEGNAKRWGVPFDRASLDASLAEAKRRLAILNPQSRALLRRHAAALQPASPPESPPDSPPDSPPVSGRGRKGQGREGKGKGKGFKPSTLADRPLQPERGKGNGENLFLPSGKVTTGDQASASAHLCSNPAQQEKANGQTLETWAEANGIERSSRETEEAFRRRAIDAFVKFKAAQAVAQ